MAEYHILTRTNFFHVSDEDLFLNFMERVIVTDDRNLEIRVGTDTHGLTTYSFATDGMIVGVMDDDGYLIGEYDEFIAALQECVEEGDAIIMLETSVSDLFDVQSCATIITSEDSDYFDLQELASDKAVELIKKQRSCLQ